MVWEVNLVMLREQNLQLSVQSLAKEAEVMERMRKCFGWVFGPEEVYALTKVKAHVKEILIEEIQSVWTMKGYAKPQQYSAEVSTRTVLTMTVS
jgi:hypothetical protein